MQKQQSTLKLIALSGVPLVMVLGNSMLIPIFPQIQKALHISQLQVGLTITLFSLPAGLSIPILGFLADKVGRKKIIVPALVTYGLGGLISGLAAWLLPSPYYVLLAGRIVQGIGAAGTAPIAMALVGDIFRQQERSKALGIIEAANGMGKVLSPILGSLIALIIWYALFFVYAFLSFPVAMAIWLLIKEPPLKTENRSLRKYLQVIKAIFRRKGKSLAGCYLAGSVVLLILFGILSFLSDVLESRYHLTGVLKGLALSVPVLAMSTTSYLSGRFLQKRNYLLKAFVLTGLLVTTGALSVVAIMPKDWVFFSGVFLTGLGTGLVLPAINTLVTSAVPLEERGGITALYGSVRFFGVALGPPSFSMLLAIGKTPMLVTGAALAGVAAAVAWWAIDLKQLVATGKKAQRANNPVTEEKTSLVNQLLDLFRFTSLRRRLGPG